MNELLELKAYKRKCELYLRALWGKDFSVQQASEDESSSDNDLFPLSYRVKNEIYLPAKVSLNQHYYRASSSHAAAYSFIKF